MEVIATNRGFALISFKDRNDIECSLQKSSVATEDCIWLGCDDPNAQIFPGNNTGWHPYPLPENVSCSTRMHLSQDQVRMLLPYLQKFVKTGELA